MIIINSLKYSYPTYNNENKSALTDISFTINESEIVGVIGTSGSGKSTLLKCLAKVVKFEPGSVQNVFKPNKVFCDKISLVIQEPEQQFFLDSVYDEVGFALGEFISEELRHSKIMKTLQLVGFDGDTDQSPFRLSGGQQRRVALASVLVMEPSVLLLDEPTIGLDSAGLKVLRRLAKYYKQNNGTFVIASHNIEFLYSIVDRFLVLSKGKLIADFKAEQFAKYKEILEGLEICVPELVRIKERSLPETVLLQLNRDIDL